MLDEDGTNDLVSFASSRATSSHGIASSEATSGVLRATAQANFGSSASAFAYFFNPSSLFVVGQGNGTLQYKIHVTGRLNNASDLVDSEAGAIIEIDVGSQRTRREFAIEVPGQPFNIDTIIVTDPIEVQRGIEYALDLQASLEVFAVDAAAARLGNTLRFVGAIVTDADGNSIDDFSLTSSSYDYKAGVATVPEPSAFAYGLLGMLCMTCRRRFV